MGGAYGIPAIHAVDGDIDVIAAAFEELAFELADGDRVVDDQDGAGLFARPIRGWASRPGGLEPAAVDQVVDGADQVLDVDDQDGPAVFENRGAVDVGDLAEAGVEGPDVEVALAEDGVDDDAEGLAAVADHDDAEGLLGLVMLRDARGPGRPRPGRSTARPS